MCLVPIIEIGRTPTSGFFQHRASPSTDRSIGRERIGYGTTPPSENDSVPLACTDSSIHPRSHLKTCVYISLQLSVQLEPNARIINCIQCLCQYNFFMEQLQFFSILSKFFIRNSYVSFYKELLYSMKHTFNRWVLQSCVRTNGIPN